MTRIKLLIVILLVLVLLPPAPAPVSAQTASILSITNGVYDIFV